ncbi:hypothetical protein [Dyella silvatica]|uniref:hypothetical protein n=1 Tax=Dyella silvatica TaxID=2992128 RepID=UPI002252E983|nr:hypothetical protein [Dyella silvatica]
MNTMNSADAVPLSLTGSDSHKLVIAPGMGSLVVGPSGGMRRPDLIVEPDQAIDWHVFDKMRTGAGSNWPRYISYEGNDTSLFTWMRERETEEVTFAPSGDLEVDASDANLGGLTLKPGSHRIKMTLPRTLRRLSIMGNPKRVHLDVPVDGKWPDIYLADDDSGTLTSVDGLPYLASVQSLGIRNTVLGAPFDCRSLLALRNLTHIRLYGAMAHLDALAELPLNGLELRFVSDLDGLPDLGTWPGLSYFIAWNVEESVGKALRKAVKQLPDSEDTFFNVSQLRSKQWFIEEHGLPFASWTSKNEKIASKAYKAASKILKKATTKAEARNTMVAFVETINGLAGIETSERDDAGDAVALLAEVNPTLMTPEEALIWFDEIRDF